MREYYSYLVENLFCRLNKEFSFILPLITVPNLINNLEAGETHLNVKIFLIFYPETLFNSVTISLLSIEKVIFFDFHINRR